MGRNRRPTNCRLKIEKICKQEQLTLGELASSLDEGHRSFTTVMQKQLKKMLREQREQAKPPETHEIVFRHVSDNAEGIWDNIGVRTYVEYFEPEADFGYPLGMVCVTQAPDEVAILDIVFVLDHFRRQGIARRLLEACYERWDRFLIRGIAISDAGQGLLDDVGRR